MIEALRCVKHRGAVAADGKTGDGAGILLPLAPALVAAPRGGLAMVFLRDESARAVIERACTDEGIELAGWREVPLDLDQLGATATASMPKIEQLHLLRPAGLSDDEAELRAYRARKRIERETTGAYVCSLSFRTVTYKGLVGADLLGDFYLDLQNREIEVPFGVFHQRFATNTTPTWERAQPFRFLCHNGEINAVAGNVNWMRAREARLGTLDDSALAPVIEEPDADSRCLDNALELLVRGGGAVARDVRHAFAMLIPEAWEGNTELEDDVRDFYRYHSGLVEPWDGPAGIVFTDGTIVGAGLDRNGLRPLRYAIGDDGLVVCSSEAGVVAMHEGSKVKRGKLGPGQMLAVDPSKGGVQENVTIKKWLAQELPYGRWLDGQPHRRLDRRAGRGAGGGPLAPARRLRLHARGAERHPPPDRVDLARGDLLDGRRLGRDAARQSRPPLAVVLQAALRAGHESTHRPPARASRDEPAHAPRRACSDPHGGSRGGAADRAGELPRLPGGARRVRDGCGRRDVHA